MKKNDDVRIGSREIKTLKFSVKSGKTIAKMIILDELRFSTLEHKVFRRPRGTLCPNSK